VIHLCPKHHPKRVDDRLGRRSIWIDAHHLNAMGDATVEGVISGSLKIQKTISKWKISTTRKRGFEAEIGDLCGYYWRSCSGPEGKILE